MKVFDTFGISIGYHFPHIAPVKVASLTAEDKNKLKQMLSRIENSKHEYQLYKDIEQSIDEKEVELVGPKIARDQSVKVYDFRHPKLRKLPILHSRSS